jgi:stress response protein YsnF
VKWDTESGLSEPSTSDMHPSEEEAKANSTSGQAKSNNNPPGQANMPNEEVIPINEEKFSILKETVTEEIKIEKRWITKTKRIQVPFLNEEVYVNNRQLKYYEKLGGNVLSKIKHRIKESFDSANNDNTKQIYSLSEEHESKREIIPLFGDANNNETNNIKEIEKVIPIFGEEIVISKRRVKLGELVIKKNRVTVNKKIEIHAQTEKATLEYPDGTKRVLTRSTG